jgi:hypothetical protein|nr:MAG TPA: hypothetical protein [Caudoviricetes sp.]
MANDIDKTSPHYKGEFGSIYEVNQKFPNGGVAGDYVEIDGWAHYWNADRGTWCVNAQRDSYWDELITNLTASLKLMRGASYMGMATPSTQPDDSLVKRFYFAKEAGTYSHFGNISVPQGISILYSSNGKQWILQNLLEISQGLGDSTTKVVSQKTLKDELGKKANASELAKKANVDSVNEIVRQINGKFSTQEQEINKKANAVEVNNVVRELKSKDSELEKKLNQKAEQSAVNASMRQLSSEVARKADQSDFEQLSSEVARKTERSELEAAVKKLNAKDSVQDREIAKKAEKSDIAILKDLIRAATGMPQDLLDKMVEYNEVLENAMPILRSLREITEDDIDSIIAGTYVPDETGSCPDTDLLDSVKAIDIKVTDTSKKLDQFISSDLTTEQVNDLLEQQE